MNRHDLKLAQEIMAALKDVDLPSNVSITLNVDYNGINGIQINVYRV